MLGEEVSSQDPTERFELLERLGEGSYGSVFKALDRETAQTVAIKVIPVESELDDMMREIDILRRCANAHIVSYYGSYLKDSDLWIAMEYCGAGSAADLMAASGRTLTEAQIAVVCACVCRGLHYLHENHNIHRDIKAGNILLSHLGQAKLADFGVSAQLANTISKRRTVIGTPFWMAPEVIQETSYDGKADIWSLGITAIELADGSPPYSNIHPMRAIFMIPSRPPPTLEKPEDFSDGFNSFVAACLKKDPAERPTAAELMQHPFIADAVCALEASETSSSPVLQALVEESMDAITHFRSEEAAAQEEQAGGAGTMVHLGSDSDDGAGTMVYRSDNGAGADSGTMVFNAAGADSGTMVFNSADNDSGTMVFNSSDSGGDSGTMVFNSGSDSGGDSGTMVFNSGTMVEASGTMRSTGSASSGASGSSGTGDVPAFMKFYRAQAAEQQAAAAAAASGAGAAGAAGSAAGSAAASAASAAEAPALPQPTNGASAADIEAQIAALDAQYEADAAALRKAYDARRDALVAALASS